MPVKQSEGKYVFSLYGINIEKIDEKYGLIPSSFGVDVIPKNTTKLELIEPVQKIPEIISFLDETKKLKKCTVSFINLENAKNKKYRCFWDRHTIPEDIDPVSCPIKFIPTKISKTYYSEMIKDYYNINEFITQNRLDELTDLSNKKIIISRDGYYETDGVFCSFNCCMAYIKDKDNINDSLYRYSENYLNSIYNDYINTGEITRIKEAPHWRTLDCHGGKLTIKQFRDSFNRNEYVNRGTISIGYLFEDNIRLS